MGLFLKMPDISNNFMKVFVNILLKVIFILGLFVFAAVAQTDKKTDQKNKKKQEPVWRLDTGPLAPLYQNMEKNKKDLVGRQMSLELRLGYFDIHREQLLLYDNKGNPLVLKARVLLYNGKVLADYRKLVPGVKYMVRFELIGLDIRKRLYGQLVFINRLVLKDF